MSKKLLFPLFAIIFLAALGLFWKHEQQTEPAIQVASFEDCVKAGYEVSGVDVRQCKTLTGKIFLENSSQETCRQDIECGSGQKCVEGVCSAK